MEPKLDPTKAKKPPRPQTKIILYWPPEEIQIWRTFRDSMEREGKTSASEQVRNWVKDWYQKHAPGNPQTPLERFKPGSQPITCKHKSAFLDVQARTGDARTLVKAWKCANCFQPIALSQA